jgi:hypothetical protein
MMEEEKKRYLLDFLDRKIFDPVFEASPVQYSLERDRKMLEDVQRNAALERRKLHHDTRSAGEVRNIYLKDLYLETEGAIGRELEDLELPRLREVRDEFLGLCEDLEV